MNRTKLLITATAACALGAASCSSPQFDNIPRNGYITRFAKDNESGSGFASFWASDNVRQASGSQAVYIKPVSLDHYSASGSAAANSPATIGLRNYFDNRLRNVLSAANAANPSFHIVAAPGPGVCTLETALLSSTPANIKGNAIAAAADNLAGSLAGCMMRDSDDAGSVCMGAKFHDPDGKLVMEVADWRQGDPDDNRAAQVNLGKYSFNLRDFQRYGYARQSINAWADQLAALFSPERKPAPWFLLSGK